MKGKQMQITQFKSTCTVEDNWIQENRSQMNHDRQDYDYRKLQWQLHSRLDKNCTESE